MELRSPPPPTTVRRNPPRRAKQTPSTIAPVAVSSAAAGIAPFPVDELIQPEAKKPSTEGPENLKVFLRVRPLEIRPKPVKNPKLKPRQKLHQAPSPKGGRTKSSNKACLIIKDSSSVTLTSPPSLLDSKRSKTELYDGFSFVFPPESVQERVYEKVMHPLLMDFMGGKSALLAAMGPTGSGKTHTMFGSPREPGLVPLALQNLFNNAMASEECHLSRSYYLSMFEICSERGKGERIFDLSPDGGDLSFQQSTIKGLQEIRISDATQAESLVALGLLKRATAPTSANNQSSRSQCIINIRCTLENISDKNDLSAHSAVLTIADLAGAERERKTGNQGARLLESNFINNTSMVFGLCLRSLLEHQRKPKKSFEKHFKNSLLTRYLREYLEGKKRMTLILTVKPGEDDYLDTSFLLRQASPYMKIKFNVLEDVPSAPHQKRNTTSIFGIKENKRRKLNSDDAEVVEVGKTDGDVPCGDNIFEKEAKYGKLLEIGSHHTTNLSSESLKAIPVEPGMNKELQVELARMKRNDEVMKKFSRALWSVLKQYKNKLEESENEVKHLKETLQKENNKVMELQHELSKLKCCSCYGNQSSGGTDSSDAECAHSASTPTISSLHPADFQNLPAHFTGGLSPLPISYSPEIPPTAGSDNEVLGLKGILLHANLTGDNKSSFHSPIEQRSFVVERQKISAYDVVCSSLPRGSLDSRNNQVVKAPVEGGSTCQYLESLSDVTKTVYEDASCSSVLNLTAEGCWPVSKQMPSKEDEKQQRKSFTGQGHCRSNSVDASSLRVTEMPCSGSLDSQNNQRAECLTEGQPLCQSLDSQSDINKLIHPLDSAEASYEDASCFSVFNHAVEDCPTLAKEMPSEQDEKLDSSNARGLNEADEDFEVMRSEQNMQPGPECFQGYCRKSVTDVSCLKVTEESSSGGSTDFSVTSSQMGDNTSIYFSSEKCITLPMEKQPKLHGSFTEELTENESCDVREHLKSSSTKTPQAEKPKRRLRPVSSLLLKEFSGLDMEAENAKDKYKPGSVARRRTQGSMCLVRLLTSKQ